MRRARELLARKETETASAPAGTPVGVTTLSDILDAERRLGAAQAELRNYQRGDDGMRETLDSKGIKGVVIERHRLEQVERLQAKVTSRHLELRSVKQAWLAGLES